MFEDAFIGTIALTGYQFAPYGWADCRGQTLQTNQYSAVYAAIGFIYGGSGTSEFNLPNLQGYVPMGFGQGPGLPFNQIGQATGAETTQLTPSMMPAHGHSATVTNTVTSPAPSVTVTNNLTLAVSVNALSTDSSATSDVGGPNLGLASPPGVAPAPAGNKPKIYGPAGSTALAGVNPAITGAATATITLASWQINPTMTVQSAGGNSSNQAQSFSLIQPSQVVRPIFCMDGIFPTRP